MRTSPRTTLLAFVASTLLVAGHASAGLAADISKTVVLRMSVGGGLAPEAAASIEVPVFTLYGDGSIIFRRSTAADPPGPLWTTSLSESAVDGLIEDARTTLDTATYRDGGRNGSIADAPRTTITLAIDGTPTARSINVLGTGGNASDAIVEFASRLGGVDAWLPDDVVPTPFAAAWYAVVFIEEDPELPGVEPWPWTDLSVDDLIAVAGGGSVVSALLRPDQVALVLDEPSGPRSDIVLATTDGDAYRMLLRPLLPDEVDALDPS